MEHFKDNSGCSGPKKSEIFWNNSRKVQYVFAGVLSTLGYLGGLFLIKKKTNVLSVYNNRDSEMVCSEFRRT